MRTMIGLLAVLIFAGLPFAAPAVTYYGSAPADEYFGPHKQSILEIRNRLDHLEAMSNRELIDSNAIVELDDLAAAISDWCAQYPDDPWLPRAYARLLRTYERAGASSSDSAVAAWDEMQTNYPNAPETADVAMYYGASPQLPLVADAPMPVQELAPPPTQQVELVPVQPVVAAVPMLSPTAWVRFGSMRGNVGAYAPAAMVPAVVPVAAAQHTTTVTVTVTTNH